MLLSVGGRQKPGLIEGIGISFDFSMFELTKFHWFKLPRAESNTNTKFEPLILYSVLDATTWRCDVLVDKMEAIESPRGFESCCCIHASS